MLHQITEDCIFTLAKTFNVSGQHDPTWRPPQGQQTIWSRDSVCWPCGGTLAAYIKSDIGMQRVLNQYKMQIKLSQCALNINTKRFPVSLIIQARITFWPVLYS